MKQNGKLTPSMTYVILGIILVLFPRLSTELVCILAGAVLVIYGAVTLIGFFAGRRESGGFMLEPLLGVLAVVVGGFLLAHPGFILSVIPFILGVYILLDGAVNLKRGLDMRTYGYAGWTTTLTMSVISLILGAAIVWNPFKAGINLWRIIGAVFIYQGMVDVFAIRTLDKLSRDE